MKYLRLLSGLILFIIFPSSAYCQLNQFELNVTATNETCLGNGSLSFSVANATSGAEFLYTVYKLPNTVTPIYVGPLTSIGSLNFGSYKVVAIQELADLSNSDETQVEIQNFMVPLEYTIAQSNVNCSQGAELTISATSGSLSQCEIISGPETRPLQTSNTFTDLSPGTYNIRAYNECGEGVVTTFTVTVNSASLTISEPFFSQASSNCDSVVVSNTISGTQGIAIGYPLTVVYTIHPPDGSANIIYTVPVADGAATTVDISKEVPLFNDQPYNYDIKVTDNCNNTYTATNLTIDPQPSVTLSQPSTPCGQKYLEVTAAKFKAPYTLTFINSPNGFAPVAYNAGYPGPFTTSGVQFGGDTNPVPAGVYKVQLTDACGRTADAEVTITNELTQPVALGRNNGCYSLFGRIAVQLPNRNLVSAIVIDAPDNYEADLPHNVTTFIIDGKLRLENVPVGSYIIKVVDECGNEYTVTVEVPPFVEQDFNAITVPYCTEGIGAVQVASGNGKLVSLSITSAPAGFGETLPFNVSANITSSGKLFMGDLPEGSYTFSGTDICGISRTVSVQVQGYHPDAQPFTFIPNCGSFDIELSDADTTSSEPTYWLQKKQDLTGQWGNPQGGAIYTEGTTPTESTGIQLTNNETRHNLLYQGTFRIIKSFKSMDNSVQEKNCLEIWDEFTFSMDLKIANAYSLECAGHEGDVFIEAVNGLMPYTYRIVTKDGASFPVDNGTNNIFSGLQPGSYQVIVEDACHNEAPSTINVGLLPSLVTAHQPADMLLCIEPGEAGPFVFDLTEQNAQILGEGQHPNNYTVTYHLTQEDAENNTNPLPGEYTSVSNPQTIYARVVHNSITVCNDIVSFTLNTSENPSIATTTRYLCENEPILLTAVAGFDEYKWSTDETTPNIIVDTPGTYSVRVRKYFGDRYCEGIAEIVVAPSGAADVISVDTEDWTYDQNSITVNVSGNGNYEYSLDGVNFQPEPTFNNLVIGNYTVYIKDKNGCGSTEQQVLLLNYPNFFTPNGDGTHDTWRIKYSYMEPDMKIDIIDRYGKHIASLKPDSEGWDGTYNGNPLPSTDYWFIVTRASGQVHKGHFAMKR